MRTAVAEVRPDVRIPHSFWETLVPGQKRKPHPLPVVRGLLDKKTGEVVGREDHLCDRDECNRPDTTLEGLAALKPHFDQTSGQGSVTAGNSSQLSDGASATLLMSRERAEALGVTPKLIFRGFAVAGWLQ